MLSRGKLATQCRCLYQLRVRTSGIVGVEMTHGGVREGDQTSSESGRTFLGYDGGMVKGAEEESKQAKSYLKNLHAESVCDEPERKLNNLL